jgi:hypothetical protein
MSADTLLSRLDRVRKTGTGRWVACCPAHGDKAPSLSIRELPDGRVLLHCFAGCPTESVLGAAGLSFGDLMPPDRLGDHVPRERRPFSAHDVLRIAAGEALVAANIASAVHASRAVSDVDLARLWLAAGRLAHAKEVAHGS